MDPQTRSPGVVVAHGASEIDQLRGTVGSKTSHTDQLAQPLLTVMPDTARPGYFTAHVDGRLLCHSRQPFLDSARALLAAGYNADTVLVMRHAGSSIDSSAFVSDCPISCGRNPSRRRPAPLQFRRIRSIPLCRAPSTRQAITAPLPRRAP